MTLYNLNGTRAPVLSFIKVTFDVTLSRRALVDTGACENVIMKSFYQELIKSPRTRHLVENNDTEYEVVKTANGSRAKVFGRIFLTFQLAQRVFREPFLILDTTTPFILGHPFLFIKHDVTIRPARNLLCFPDLAVHINEIKPIDGPRRTIEPTKISVRNTKKIVIPSYEQKTIPCTLCTEDALSDLSGMIIPNDNLECEFDMSIMSSLSTVQKDNLVNIIVLNITDHPVTINRDKELAKFAILTADQTDKLTAIDPFLVNVAYSMGPQHFESTINQLIRDENFVGPLQPPKPERDYKTFWFPTPETCDDPRQLTPIQREIYDQILRLKQLETRDPRNNEKDRREFLDQFPWDKSVLTLEQRAEVQQLLLKYHDVFAKHRFDIGYNTEFKVKLTPEHDQPVYTQGLPTPILLQNELHVHLALFHYFGLITTLAYSKYSSPLFAQRKSN